MARQHVIIRREQWVAGTREKPEVGVFTQTHTTRPPVPWNKLLAGENVWMKWSSGPIVARAVVQGFRQLERCTPALLRQTTAGFKLHDLDEYWDNLQPTFFGMTIYLGDERWLDEPIQPATRSRGESWIVIDTDDKEKQWLVNTPGREESSTRKGVGRSRTIGHALRFQVFRRDDFCCQYCGRRPPEVVLHVDHIVPFSQGGESTLANLRTACQDCNLGKGASPARQG